MTRNKTVASLLIVGVLAASVSTSALAGDRGHRHGGGGNGAAIAAGILGAVVVGSLIANSQPVYAAPQPYYAPPPQPVYQPAPQVYYPAPVQQSYYVPAQPYYAPQPVTVIRGRYHY
jgi:hypothetical protein